MRTVDVLVMILWFVDESLLGIANRATFLGMMRIATMIM